jgi:hypothetical protein
MMMMMMQEVVHCTTSAEQLQLKTLNNLAPQQHAFACNCC